MSLKARAREERGQDLVEYAVLTGSIAILVIVGAGLFGVAVDDWFDKLTTWFGKIGPV
jgi:Flp pilus assembly pilin Flp